MRVELDKSDGLKPLWSDLVSPSQTVDKKVDGVVVDVQKLQKLTNELELNKIEQDEQAKRKYCAFVQGLVEVSGSNSEERQKKDSDSVIDQLHQIHCYNVSVTSCFRLWKSSVETVTKPRPIKIVLASEAQKEQVLRAVKNLKLLINGLEKVFIH